MGAVTERFRPTELSWAKPRRAAYCRVSTPRPGQLKSELRQERYFVELLASDQSSEFVGVYHDTGKSGTTTQRRVGFQQLVEDCRAGRIDAIHTKSISRMARNTVDALKCTRELRELGVDVYFEKEDLHTNSPEGELFLTLMAALAQHESVSLSDSIRWTKRKRFACGDTRCLSAQGILGLDRDEEGRIVVVEEEAEILRRIYREFLNGHGVSAIAAALNGDGVPAPAGGKGWSTADILNNLRNEKHCGDCLFQKTYKASIQDRTSSRNTGELPMYFAEGVLPAVVDKKTWRLVQLELAWRQERGSYVGGRDHPFLRRMVCGSCGKTMVTETGRNGKRHWRCGHFVARSRKPGDPPCDDARIPYHRPPQAFLEGWNRLVETRPELTAPEDDPLGQYRVEDLAGLLETVGRIEGFDYDLFVRTVERLEVAHCGAVTVVFRAGVRVTV